MVWQGALTGIDAPVGLVPEPAGLVGYFGAFAVGWLLSGDGGALHRLAAGWRLRLLAAAALSATVVVTAMVPAMAQSVPALAQQVIVALGAWCATFGLVGAAVRHLTTERPLVRYLADASYWMYLLHLPLLSALELLLADLTWPVPVKILAVWTPTLAVLLLSDDVLVRPTWVGAWLNGRRYPRLLTRRGR